MRTTVRRSVSGATLAAGVALLTACGAQPAGDAAAPATTSGSAVPADELRDALLPASAFGPDATVLGVSLDQLGASLPGLGGLPEGTTVDPALCGAALTMLPGPAGDPPTLVARAALAGDVRTLEVLADGPALDGLRLPIDQLLRTCGHVTVTAADRTTTAVDLAGLGVPPLGDADAGLQVTVTGPQGTTTALVGVVSAGPRALLLAQSGAVPPDVTAFTRLLGEAADAAA